MSSGVYLWPRMLRMFISTLKETACKAVALHAISTLKLTSAVCLKALSSSIGIELFISTLTSTSAIALQAFLFVIGDFATADAAAAAAATAAATTCLPATAYAIQYTGRGT